jgi:hypothetical protein
LRLSSSSSILIAVVVVVLAPPVVDLIGQPTQRVNDVRNRFNPRLVGSYLLICNVPGHYAAGMAAPLIVAP